MTNREKVLEGLKRIRAKRLAAKRQGMRQRQEEQEAYVSVLEAARIPSLKIFSPWGS